MSHSKARHAQFEIGWVNSNPCFNGSFHATCEPGQSKWMYFGVCAGPQMFRICLPLYKKFQGLWIVASTRSEAGFKSPVVLARFCNLLALSPGYVNSLHFCPWRSEMWHTWLVPWRNVPERGRANWLRWLDGIGELVNHKTSSKWLKDWEW